MTWLDSLKKALNKSKPINYASDKKIAELILSDGSFCSIYQVTYKHLELAESKNSFEMYAKVLSMVLLIDDKPITIEQVYNLPLKDINKIIEYVTL
jgi:hypothetical protein